MREDRRSDELRRRGAGARSSARFILSRRVIANRIRANDPAFQIERFRPDYAWTDLTYLLHKNHVSSGPIT